MFYIYKNGKDFLTENKEILNKDYIATSFLRLDASLISEVNSEKYILKYEENGHYLIALYFSPFNLVLYGDISLTEKMSKEMLYREYEFSSVLGPNKLACKFMEDYCRLSKGEYTISLSMDIMTSNNKIEGFFDNSIRLAKKEDVDALSFLVCSFNKEALGENKTIEESKEYLLKNQMYENIYILEKDGKIASIAKLTRNEEKSAAISLVYTKEEYRGNHYAYQVVGYITNLIQKNGKIPYLYVDKKNPISNQLYSSLGYEYLEPFTEIKYHKKNNNIESYLSLELHDLEFSNEGYTHERNVVRSIVIKEGKIAILSIFGEDIFGHREYYETPGGGVEENESLEEAILRELDEEIGYKCEIIEYIGTVRDEYNLLKRKNINHYYLCQVKEKTNVHLVSEGDKMIRSICWVPIEEAISLYENTKDTPISILVKNREIPILYKAQEMMKEKKI